MAFENLSKTCLPAWHAIKSSESLWFLVYLMMLTFGCMLAYYALPVPDVMLGSMAGYLLAFTRIFRLTLMGDFDMWGLEGVDDRLQIDHNKTTLIQHGVPDEQMHNALRLWVLMLALVFAVVLLNVYVGIIGKEYEDAKDKGIAVAGRFRILCSFRLLLHRRFWKKACGGYLSLDLLTKGMLRCQGKFPDAIPKNIGSPYTEEVAFIRMDQTRHRQSRESREDTGETSFRQTVMNCLRSHADSFVAESPREREQDSEGIEAIIRKAVEDAKALSGKKKKKT
eukprot:CAMPEP_0169288340 /NCGR_PEP_ID=MMETSP1016-20121227/60500_1 /TAXON_ID=342587 /ORGANISM="Karlodinium micrum, Strain CCMP2283" /LENGTH=280 /DNA_ID=CAMNT_0009378549 /DNA_START=483 /DNA_END=1325 /DNA_ORIENTATION=-